MKISKGPPTVGIISAIYGFEEEKITHELNRRRMKNVFIDSRKVTYQIRNQQLCIYYEGNRLKALSIGLVRQTRSARVATLHLIRALNNMNIRTIDSFEVIALGTSKFKAILDRLAMGFTVPNTVTSPDYDSASELLKTDDFPMIYKPLMGRKGIGIEEIKTPDTAEAQLDRIEKNETGPLLLQEKLDIKEEYRVLVVGFQVVGTTRKIASEGSIARNVAQGATLVHIEGRSDVESLASDVARKTKREIAGVDIIETTDGKLYVIECNRNPGFQGFMKACPGIDVPKIIVDYVIGDFN